MGDYDRTRALADGRVLIDGVDPVYMQMNPEEMFFRAMRSVDFDIYKIFLDMGYPDPFVQLVALNVIQMLWDRGETNGYAQHLTRTPYPHTPRHTVLLLGAVGDHQVS